MNELCTRSAQELAQLIGSKQVSSAEVVEAHLARIDETNPTVKAITEVLADEARRAAAAVDQRIHQGESLGVLAGVPFTIKGNIDVAGSATTWGVSAFAAQVASVDAPMVARLREAGAIPLARTNLPDLALRWDTVSGLAGRTGNPWDLGRTPGGSSGGEAVALATGMTPFGLGNDLGGSLRVPSQMCGTTALRPTRGRVAHDAVTQPWPESLVIQLTNCQGPMARRVADLRLCLEIISGFDPRDPRWVPAVTVRSPLEERCRIAVVRNPTGGGIDPHVQEGVDRAARWLAEAGHEMVEIEPPQIADVAAKWFTAIWADVGAIWPQIERIVGAEEISFVNASLAKGVFRSVGEAERMAVWADIYQHGSAWSRFFHEYPVVLAPVCCEPPWPSGDDITRVEEIAAAMRMVVPVNILGLPSCAVPVGCDSGLPQGVQLIGASFQESRLLTVAQEIEDRAGIFTPIEPRLSRHA